MRAETPEINLQELQASIEGPSATAEVSQKITAAKREDFSVIKEDDSYVVSDSSEEEID